jgi:small subunit ribosomal protein S1
MSPDQTSSQDVDQHEEQVAPGEPVASDHGHADALAAPAELSAEQTEQATPSERNGDVPSAAEQGAESARPRVRLNPSVDPSKFRAVANIEPGSPGAPPTTASGAEEAPRPAATRETAEPVAAEVEEKPQPAPAASPRSAPVDIPPAEALEADLEAQLAAAMSGEEQREVTAPAVQEAAESAPPARPPEEELTPGTRLTGKVQSVGADNSFLDLGYRSPGIVSNRQFEQGKPPQVGQVIEVVVDRVDQAEGLIYMNLPKGRRRVGGNWEALTVGQIVDCMANKTNKGGLEITVSGLRGFLPASQVELGFVSDMNKYVGQKLTVQVTEVNPQKRNLVVSRRAYLQQERKQAEEQLWKTLEVGQTYSGTVKTIKDYGAFVDIGGVDGFLHVGEITWTRIRHPSDVLKEGQQIEVQVINLDPGKKKISLGMRQLTRDPWAAVVDSYPPGSTVTGKVTRTTDFGAFVELEPGLEGLIHISELDYRRVRSVTEVLKVGQEATAKVLEVDPSRKRVSLSLKALKEKPEEKKAEDEPSAESYERKRKGPLKGGTTGAPAGGGLFGDPNRFGR